MFAILITILEMTLMGHFRNNGKRKSRKILFFLPDFPISRIKTEKGIKGIKKPIDSENLRPETKELVPLKKR